MLDAILFYAFAGVALGSALIVVGQRNPTYSAFALIATLCALSAIYGLLGSPFIAVLQIVVYAGAIMVLFLFVLMLLAVKREEHGPEAGGGRTLKAVALGLALLLVVQVGMVILRLPPAAPERFTASSAAMARLLFSAPYLYAFEATSVLILAALVGAVVLARKEP